LRRLERDLKKADREKIVNISTSSDPYPTIELRYKLTRGALELLNKYGFKVLITTKGYLVVRDKDLLNKGNAAVMITITTLDESLAKKLEPGAPSPLRRLEALSELSSSGIPVGVRIDPIIPGVNDDPQELRELVAKVRDAGALHVVTSTYKAKPDNFKRMVAVFPHLKRHYERGIRIGRYLYLPKEERLRLLKPIVEEAERLGLTWAFCREGFPFKAPSCDGSHLIGLSRSSRV